MTKLLGHTWQLQRENTKYLFEFKGTLVHNITYSRAHIKMSPISVSVYPDPIPHTLRLSADHDGTSTFVSGTKIKVINSKLSKYHS